MDEVITSLQDDMLDQFGVSMFDPSKILPESKKADDFVDDKSFVVDKYNGINTKGVSFFNSTYIKKAISSFRPYIRGFFIFLLLFYNINQFLTFIGVGSLSTLGSAITNAEIRTNKSNTKGGSHG